MFNPIMRQVLGLSDELIEAVGRRDSEALSVLSGKMTELMPDAGKIDIRVPKSVKPEDRATSLIEISLSNRAGKQDEVITGVDTDFLPSIFNTEKGGDIYTSKVKQVASERRKVRQEKIDAREQADINSRFEARNRGELAVATHDISKPINMPIDGAEGPVQYGARNTSQFQNRKGKGSPDYHDPAAFPDISQAGEKTPGKTPMSPVQRAQMEGASPADAARATDQDRITGAKPGGVEKAKRDAAYMQAVKEGKTGYNGEQSKLDDINAQIDKAFDGPKSNKGSNPVSSEKAGYEGFQSGGLAMNFIERHGAGAMIGAGAGMMSEGEVSAGGAARGAMFGVMGGKAARMVTGSMKGGSVNALGKSLGSKIGGMGAEGGAANKAGQYLQETMEGFAGSKSQEAFRMATFAGAGLAGFSMGRDRSHSRGLNSGRGNGF